MEYSLLIFFIGFLFLFASRDADPFSPVVFLNVYYLILIVVGPVIMSLVLPSVYGVGNYKIVLYLLTSSFCLINAGFFVSKFMFFPKSKKIMPNTVSLSKNKQKVMLVISLVMVFLCILSTLIFFIRAGQIPMLQEDKEAARVAAISISGNGYLLYFMTFGMFGVLIMSCFSMQKRNSLYYMLLFFCFIIAGGFLTFTGSRRYILWMLLYIILSYHYMVKPFSFKIMSFFGFFVIVFINVFEIFRNPNSDTTKDIFIAMYYRMIIYTSNLEKVFSSFKNIDSMYGSTFFMDILTALPGKSLDYQSWLKEKVGLSFEGFGIPPTIVGDLFVNFGYVGVLIGSFIYGFIVYTFYFYLVRSERSTPIKVFIHILILELASKMLTSGISPQVMGGMWAIAVMTPIILIIYFVDKKKSKEM